MIERPPLRCPTCDGAMIEKPEPRCVRCGMPNPKMESFQELLDRGVKFRIPGPPEARQYVRGIQVVGTPYEITVNWQSIFLYRPYKPGIGAASTDLLEFDRSVSSTNRAYWNRIRAEVFALLPNHGNLALFLWKRIKAERMYAQRKTWRQVLPPNIVEWARGVLDEVSKDDDCVDNYRVACARISSQRRRYLRQKASGCCGFRDFTRDGPDGQLYMLGYNYGH